MEFESLNNSKFILNNQEMKQILGGETPPRDKCTWEKDCEGTLRPIYYIIGCVKLPDGSLTSIKEYGPTDKEIANGTKPDSVITNCGDEPFKC